MTHYLCLEFKGNIKWDNVFKNEPSKICGLYPVKNLKWHGPLNRPYHFKYFKRPSSKNFIWSSFGCFAPNPPPNIHILTQVKLNYRKISILIKDILAELTKTWQICIFSA